MSIVDLASPHLEWMEAAVSGADVPVRMYPLHVDLARGTRTVLVEYPDGWARHSAGSQFAGEEFVPVSGAFTMSGCRVEPGSVLVTPPRALRSQTATQGTTRAVVFFSGPGGGWVEDDPTASGAVWVRSLEEGFVREETDGLVGRLELWEALPREQEFLSKDAEVLWLDASRYAFVPQGGVLPEVDGRVLVRLLD